MDDFQNQFVAQFLRTEAPRLADAAARSLLSAHPDLVHRYHPLALDKWRESFTGRVLELAAAVGAGSPALLEQQVAWSRTAFTARSVPLEDLRASLHALAETLPVHLPDEDRPLVLHFLQRALAAARLPAEAPPPILHANGRASSAAAQYLLAILEGRRHDACRVIVDAVRNGAPLLAIHTDILVPVLQEVGRLWHLGEITVAEEHFATATSMMAMSQAAAFEPRDPPSGRTFLTAAVEDNLHELGLRMLADVFEARGWRSIHLGASIPAQDIVAGIRDFTPDLVALSATMPQHIQTASDTIADIRAAFSPAPRIIVGGRAFLGIQNSLPAAIGADGAADSIADALALAETLCPPRK